MAAKIVVIVENQNARVFPCALAEEISSCQSADASADDYQVIFLAGICRFSKGIRAFAVSQPMRDRDCSVMIAATSLPRRRLIIRPSFRRDVVRAACGCPR